MASLVARPFAADAPILLSGPPGAGKSTVGRLAARAIGVPFVDLDERISERAGASIATLFTRDGEPGFRVRERAELEALLDSGERRLIALGGGTLLDPALRALALGCGVVVGLRAPVDTLARRLAEDAPRPLLAGGDRSSLLERLEVLLQARGPTYEHAHVHLDAARPPGVVATDVARVARARWAYVGSGSGGYPVRLGRDAGAGAADAAFALAASSRVIVTDDRVAPTWADATASTMAALGVPNAGRLVFPHGERSKRLATLEALAEQLAEMGADRRAVLVCVGGGVVSDLGGLLAASYFRGIPWIAVPTTLLAMVDAAVGGKTAVDLARVKNAIGAFHPPRAVLVDVDHVRTEAARQMRAGLAEAVKTALVGDADLFERIERDLEAARSGDPDVLEEIVARSLAVKIGVVTRDEHERGERAHLNLGHTLGHALEAAAAYETYLHGEAVAIGLVAALRVGEARGVTEPGLAGRVERLLRGLGLPTTAPARLCDIARTLVATDKKRSGDDVRLVFVRSPGVPCTERLSCNEAAASLAEAAVRRDGTADEFRPVF